MPFAGEQITTQLYPTAASSLNGVAIDLTVGELVGLSKKDLCRLVEAAYKEKFPGKRITEKFRQRFFEDPMYAWTIRDVLEGRKWDSPQSLMEAYAELWPMVNRDAQGYFDIALGYSLDDFAKTTGLNEDLKYIRENIVNGTLMAHQRMREACGVGLPEETFESLGARLQRMPGYGVRVEQDLTGCRLVLTERVAGKSRDVDMERLGRSHYSSDVHALFAFGQMQEIFAREVHQGDKLPIVVQVLDSDRHKVAFIVLCSQEEHFNQKHFCEAKMMAKAIGVEPLAVLELPTSIPEIEAVLQNETRKMAVRSTYNPHHSCFMAYSETDINGMAVLKNEFSNAVSYAVPSLDFGKVATQTEDVIEEEDCGPCPR